MANFLGLINCLRGLKTVISNGGSVLYHVIYARVDAKGKAWNRNIENKRVTWFSLVGLRPQRNPLRATSLLYKRIIQ